MFDKQKTNDSFLKKTLGFLHDRDIMMKHRDGSLRVYRITKKFQVIIVFIMCIVLLWAVVSSLFTIYYKSSDSEKNVYISSIQKDYENAVSISKEREVRLSSIGKILNRNVEILNSTTSSSSNKQIVNVLDDLKKVTSEVNDVAKSKIVGGSKDELSARITNLHLQIIELEKSKKDLEKSVKNYKNMINSLGSEYAMLDNEEVTALQDFSQWVSSNVSTYKGLLKKLGMSDKKYINVLASNKAVVSQGGPDTGGLSSISESKYLEIKGLKENIEEESSLRSLIMSLPLGEPVKKYWLSSRFGIRKDPFTGGFSSHYGLDFAAPIGTPVNATSEGVVVFSGVKNGYGKFIEVDHGNNVVTRYGHLSKLYVRKGDTVTINQRIGDVGNTGRSSGPHLHYEILFDGKHIDPLGFIELSKFIVKEKRA